VPLQSRNNWTDLGRIYIYCRNFACFCFLSCCMCCFILSYSLIVHIYIVNIWSLWISVSLKFWPFNVPIIVHTVSQHPVALLRGVCRGGSRQGGTKQPGQIRIPLKARIMLILISKYYVTFSVFVDVFLFLFMYLGLVSFHNTCICSLEHDILY